MRRKTDRQHSLERQVARLERELERLSQVSNRFAGARLLEFVAGAVLSFGLWRGLGWQAGAIAAVVGLAGFFVLARYHGRVKAAARRFRQWQAIKREHLARIRLDWAALQPALPVTLDVTHPFETDLDLVGERSLHRLLDTSASHEGSRRLRDWLAAPVPDLPTIGARQALVHELAPLTLFRDRLRLNAITVGRRAGRRWNGEQVFAWLDEHETPEPPAWAIWTLTGLAAANLVLYTLTQIAGFPPLWGLTFAAYAGLYLWQVHRLGDIFSLALALRDPFNDLGTVFTFLENARYGRHTRLKTLCAPFLDPVRRPSAHLRRVSRVLSAASIRGNPLFWMFISVIVPWDVYVAWGMARRREQIAALLPVWLDVWFELEALGALANFAYLNPETTFPIVHESGPESAPVLRAERLGHPLIPDEVRVSNDFGLDNLGDVALITGSNMSGKSTFLRTLGVNLCLAYAGGTVVARRLETAPFRLFTCIRVADSVTDGISYFYAEVKRLKALLDALERDDPLPVFFLIDEIFRGTNNRERLIGSRSYIRALVGRHGVGVISTHDLELVRLADEMAQLENYHFTETIADGRMAFDYRLRRGPSPTTNALKIMQMEGLPVEVEA